MKTTRQNCSFRHPSRSARIAQYLGGDTLVTRTEKRPGNNFGIRTAAGSTEFTMQLKNGTVVSLNGHDSRAVLRVLLRHYGYMATGQGVGSDLSFTVEGLSNEDLSFPLVLPDRSALLLLGSCTERLQR